MIFLCGAGCGDRSLLTIKAKACLEQADCILYDHLIDPAILSYAKVSCEKIYVGKQASKHAYSQMEINQMLIEKGRTGAFVVRLKGGDPYVFGRGGEEAMALMEAGLPFEVVPGISSAIGGLAYAGIPVTHRDYTGGVRIISAHNKKNEFADLDFRSLAITDDTLVFLMGLSGLSILVRQLLKAGKPKHTPIAVASHVSMPSQHVITADLASILQKDIASITPPAIIVIGEVVKLQASLNFFERKPLFHKRYVLPLLQRDESIVKTELEAEGATVISFQCGHFQENKQAFHTIQLKDYTYLIFTSKTAINYFFSQLSTVGLDVRCLAHMKICVIGKQTADHLQHFGLIADMISDVPNSEHLMHQLQAVIKSDDSLLIVKAKNHNDGLYNGLRSRCNTQVLSIYETIPDSFTLIEQEVDGMIFSCAFNVHAVMKQVVHWQNWETIPMYSIGKQTTAALHMYGVSCLYELSTAKLSQFKDLIIKEVPHV